MEKIIEIDLITKNSLISRYNEKKVSHELLQYIINEAISTKKDEKIKIKINKKQDINQNSTKFIKDGLKEEFAKSVEARNRNDIRQLVFLFLGVLFIFLSTLIPESEISKEVLIIIGWVPIWKMIEIELFPDIYGRRKRRIIKKLLNSEFIERSID